MSPVAAPVSASRIALFDLDGTLTWGDTLVSFLSGYLLRNPTRWWRLWRLPFAVGNYLLFTRDRGALKAAVIRIVFGGESRLRLDAWADTFVAGLRACGIFRPAALAALESHRAAGDHLVLLSASPDLYVPRIGRLLGFERTLCTELLWLPGDILDGALTTANRRGLEKCNCLAWLRGRYPGLSVMAYGNSASDLPHLAQAEAALLVNGNAAARREAAGLGVPIGRWS